MAELLFKLRNVPDDEADDVRELLTQNAIDYYETSSGNWGASMPAIWLHDSSQLAQAKSLIAGYQDNRARQARAQFIKQKQMGQQKTFLGNCLEQPLRLIIYFSAIALILYLSSRIVLDLTA